MNAPATVPPPTFRYCGKFHNTVSLDLGVPQRNGYGAIIQFTARQAAAYPDICAAMVASRRAMSRYSGDSAIDQALSLIDAAYPQTGGVEA